MPKKKPFFFHTILFGLGLWSPNRWIKYLAKEGQCYIQKERTERNWWTCYSDLKGLSLIWNTLGYAVLLVFFFFPNSHFGGIYLWYFSSAKPCTQNSILIFILTLQQVRVPFPVPFAFPLLPLILGFPALPRLFTSSSLSSFFPFLLNSVYLLSYVACHVPGTFLTISEAFPFVHHGQPMYLLPRPVIPESLFFCSSFPKSHSKEL